MVEPGNMKAAGKDFFARCLYTGGSLDSYRSDQVFLFLKKTLYAPTDPPDGNQFAGLPLLFASLLDV